MYIFIFVYILESEDHFQVDVLCCSHVVMLAALLCPVSFFDICCSDMCMNAVSRRG